MDQPRANNDTVATELWKWLLHENTLFHTRSTIFVATQAVLFAGAANLLKDLQWILAVLGMTTSFIWFLAMQRQYAGTLTPVKTALMNYGEIKPDDSFFRQYFLIVKGRQSCLPGLDVLIGLILPLVFTVAWATFLIYVFPHNYAETLDTAGTPNM